MSQSDRDPDRRAKHSHYVSNSNGAIYPAQTGLPGVEDDNPVDWRPATYGEIQMFKNGQDSIVPVPKGDVNLDADAPRVSPSSLRLADDDEPATPDAGAVVVPPATQDPPPAPPAALTGLPGYIAPPPPAFNPQQ